VLLALDISADVWADTGTYCRSLSPVSLFMRHMTAILVFVNFLNFVSEITVCRRAYLIDF